MFLVHMNARSDRVASYSKEKTAEMSFVTKHVTSVKSKSLFMHRKTLCLCAERNAPFSTLKHNV